TYVYYTTNIHSVGSELIMTNYPVTFYICRTIKMASCHPLSKADSSPTYSLGCDPSRSLRKESSWLK
ncbi:hypothetical protein CN285_29995, partial [Bacillus cereus]